MIKSERVALAQYFLNAPRCGAKSRRNNGAPCKQPAMPNGRCRLHGGKSTGAKTPEGKLRSAKANLKHGLYTKQALAERQHYKNLLQWRDDLEDYY